MVVGLTIKGGKDNAGFVLLMKWCFPQALGYYDYLHDSLCYWHLQSLVLFIPPVISGTGIKCLLKSPSSSKGMVEKIRKQDFGDRINKLETIVKSK